MTRPRFWSTGFVQRENEASGSRQRRSPEEVRRLVDEFEASGLERAEFCRSRALALSTLQRHLRARRSATEGPSGQTRLVAVSVRPREKDSDAVQTRVAHTTASNEMRTTIQMTSKPFSTAPPPDQLPCSVPEQPLKIREIRVSESYESVPTAPRLYL